MPSVYSQELDRQPEFVEKISRDPRSTDPDNQ